MSVSVRDRKVREVRRDEGSRIWDEKKSKM